MQKDCIFCKIAAGKSPCYKIYEDKEFLAFLDIRPVNRGHTMVIPKKHFRWVYDVEPFGRYWEIAKEVALKIKSTLKPKFLHFVTLGEEVKHAHIHIVPRYENDNLGGLPDWSKGIPFSQEEFQKIAKEITNNKND